MFDHRQDLQFKSAPQQPDGDYARRLEGFLGGQYGEIAVAMHYMDQNQGWDLHVPGKYRDVVIGLGTEQVAQVEMLARMVAQLLESAPPGAVDDAVQRDPAVAAVIGGTDMQQAIATGAERWGAMQGHGNPWQTSASSLGDNLLADFRTAVSADERSRQQAAQLQQLSDDPEVRYLLACLLARAAAHLHSCQAAAAEFQEEGGERAYGPAPGRSVSTDLGTSSDRGGPP